MRFTYKGFNAQGHEKTGCIEAVSKEDAAGKLRSEYGLFINKLEEDNQPIVVAPKEHASLAPLADPPVPQPKQRTLDEDLEKGMEVIRLLRGAKLPKKLVERAKEEMILCLVRKAMLK